MKQVCIGLILLFVGFVFGPLLTGLYYWSVVFSTKAKHNALVIGKEFRRYKAMERLRNL